jgi:flagellar M-ring protein FliF
VIRPALRPVEPVNAEGADAAGADPTKGGQIDAMVNDPEHLPGAPGELPALEAPKANKHLDDARLLAKSNPAAVANIVSGWVSGEPA